MDNHGCATYFFVMTSRSKFNVSGDKSQRTFDGITFDSGLELKYYRDVVVPKMEAGKILRCERQKKYVLQKGFTHNGVKVRPIDYKADFYLEYDDGTSQVIDVKGFADSTALLKRKMFWYQYPEENYIWVSYSKKWGGWIEYDVLQKYRKGNKKEKKEIKD